MRRVPRGSSLDHTWRALGGGSHGTDGGAGREQLTVLTAPYMRSYSAALFGVEAAVSDDQAVMDEG